MNVRIHASCLALSAVGIALWAKPAQAHFVLGTPASWWTQDSLGSPQKLGPCGNEGGGSATGAVTAFHPGQTIPVTINEVITHPGHYRIALAVTDRSQLPPEPVVTPDASGPCGTAAVEANPTFPVLADNLFNHTAAFNGPQTVQLTLPSNITCTHCTLQIIEFMSQHPLNNPGGCFYHHCADISILPLDAGAPADAGAGPDAGNNRDAGGTPDSGGLSDSGQAADSGSPAADSGVVADGGDSPPVAHGGCGAVGGGAGLSVALIALLGLAGRNGARRINPSRAGEDGAAAPRPRTPRC